MLLCLSRSSPAPHTCSPLSLCFSSAAPARVSCGSTTIWSSLMPAACSLVRVKRHSSLLSEPLTSVHSRVPPGVYSHTHTHTHTSLAAGKDNLVSIS